MLLAAWIVVMVAAVLGWQYRNASYLLPLVPALALLAAAWGPFRTRRYAAWMLVVLAAAFLIKASAPELPWGLNYRAGTVQPTAPILSDYCSQARGNQLIVLDLADDLYASVLPLRAPALRHGRSGGGARRPVHHALCRNGHHRDRRSVQRPCPLHARLPRAPPANGRSIPARRSPP